MVTEVIWWTHCIYVVRDRGGRVNIEGTIRTQGT